ncbi:sterol esterase [Wolfiporia cocos MD-104 SS10]|uniref:Carboxylic ester hydrolase n=1 Tax=Wolfiporia cocos (strain MD-104) TaxID=742152 RepID=A0A2H3J1R0_WOLCO|nr:sterol esterase [Wolfiporia cocos MD-104 SS10]
MLLPRVCVYAVQAFALFLPSLASRNSAIVSLSYGSFKGNTLENVTSFLSVPYAQPPVEELRFAPPQPPLKLEGMRSAITFSDACPQQSITLPGLLSNIIGNTSNEFIPNVNVSEDCLTVNIYKPTFARPDSSLSVLSWIYGVFGFLASREMQNAGSTNLGLRDQRFALQWVHQYISSFGGDPDKVIIWGESAGVISVGLHLLWNNGNSDGLFRGAVMARTIFSVYNIVPTQSHKMQESGSPCALHNVSVGQPFYDDLVEYVNCSHRFDTLDCLRKAPYEHIQAWVNSTLNIFGYESLNLNPQRSMRMGHYARVPLITGDCDDGGTLFSMGNANITFLFGASSSEVRAVGQAYPSNPSLRIASFLGDWRYQAPRRLLLDTMSRTQDTWAFLYKRGKATPYLGSFHSTDLVEFFRAGDYIGIDALINFVHSMNPNTPSSLPSNVSYLSGISRDTWDSSIFAPPLLTFLDPAPKINITVDTYRSSSMALLNTLSLQIP